MPKRFLLQLGLLLLPFLGVGADNAGLTLVGVARVDITPDYAVRLSGYGNRRTESEGVEQHIWARALAIRFNTFHLDRSATGHHRSGRRGTIARSRPPVKAPPDLPARPASIAEARCQSCDAGHMTRVLAVLAQGVRPHILRAASTHATPTS